VTTRATVTTATVVTTRTTVTATTVVTTRTTVATILTRRTRHIAFGHREQLLARQTSLAVTLDADALDLDLLALFQPVRGVAAAVVGDFGDVEQRLVVRQDFDEGAEVHDALDGALVDLADLGLGREALDDGESRLHLHRIHAGHGHGAVILDVHVA